MKREIALTAAKREDIPLIVELLRENGLPFSDIPEKRDSLFLARSGGAVVGIGGVEILGKYGLLRSVAVIREERNRGYGRAVTEGLIGHATTAGVKDLYLLTTTAAPFFEGLGFERIRRDRAPLAITRTSEFSDL
jgi:N-acetylglutamate synthase-like GNAT family acetyltransferase